MGYLKERSPHSLAAEAERRESGPTDQTKAVRFLRPLLLEAKGSRVSERSTASLQSLRDRIEIGRGMVVAFADAPNLGAMVDEADEQLSRLDALIG